LIPTATPYGAREYNPGSDRVRTTRRRVGQAGPGDRWGRWLAQPAGQAGYRNVLYWDSWTAAQPPRKHLSPPDGWPASVNGTRTQGPRAMFVLAESLRRETAACVRPSCGRRVVSLTTPKLSSRSAETRQGATRVGAGHAPRKKPLKGFSALSGARHAPSFSRALRVQSLEIVRTVVDMAHRCRDRAVPGPLRDLRVHCLRDASVTRMPLR
jgi:hypothetical protein